MARSSMLEMPSMVKELAYAAAQQQQDPPACRQFLRGVR
jgi:hypothetical protein